VMRENQGINMPPTPLLSQELINLLLRALCKSQKSLYIGDTTLRLSITSITHNKHGTIGNCYPGHLMGNHSDQAGMPIVLDDAPVPILYPGTVLVKTSAVSINPSDHKMGGAFPSPGAIVSMDFVGRIMKIMLTENNKKLELCVGDIVCGTVRGSNPDDHSTGSFAEYIRAPADLVLRVPDGLPLDRAVPLGTPLLTNCVALWSSLRLEAMPDDPVTNTTPVLVYGGSTACGTMAIQLLRM
jgi:NADPH:quinone reductase-like Zn-dependent oxidoreductase